MPTAAAKADQESLTARRDSADRLLAIGREMVRRGRVQPQDFALLQKLAVHETLLPSINGDDWAEGRRKGWIDRLMEENHLSAAERDRAEAVGRRVAAIGLAEMVESGDMPPAEGRALLADVVQLPGTTRTTARPSARSPGPPQTRTATWPLRIPGRGSAATNNRSPRTTNASSASGMQIVATLRGRGRSIRCLSPTRLSRVFPMKAARIDHGCH